MRLKTERLIHNVIVAFFCVALLVISSYSLVLPAFMLIRDEPSGMSAFLALLGIGMFAVCVKSVIVTWHLLRRRY